MTEQQQLVAMLKRVGALYSEGNHTPDDPTNTVTADGGGGDYFPEFTFCARTGELLTVHVSC